MVGDAVHEFPLGSWAASVRLRTARKEKDMTDNNEQLSKPQPRQLCSPSRGSKPTTVSQPQPNNRERLLIFLAALDASPIALRRDLHRGEGRKGDYSIQGKWGHIYIDGEGFLLCVTAKDERDQSPRRWTSIKRRLAFCRITQDGDEEGCLRFFTGCRRPPRPV